MRFKPDENLPIALAADLRFAGHDVDTVADENLTGASDLVVKAGALRERRVVLTLDKGIADLIRSRLAELLTRDLEYRATVVSAQRIRGR